MHPLLILNPHAGSGRALGAFRRIEPLLSRLFSRHRVAVTQHPAEVPEALEQGANEGCDSVLALGGDGTNATIINALASRAAPPMTLGMLPLGTGRDWARTLGIPLEPEAALAWLKRAEPRAIDLGLRRADGDTRRFINVSSAGLSGEVGRRVNESGPKRPWSFLAASVQTLLRFAPPPMRVWVDGEPWFEGDSYLLAVANGRYFGRGMKVAPDAMINDGVFDVVLVEGMSRPKVLAALPTLFSGSHVKRGDVHLRRAQHVRVEAIAPPLYIEADGEAGEATAVEYEILPKAVEVWVEPSTAAVA